jgi:hypothetical protein
MSASALTHSCHDTNCSHKFTTGKNANTKGAS